MSSHAEQRYAAYLGELRARYPGFRVAPKRTSRLHRAIDRVLRVVTFGQMRDYLESYQTTIGRTVWVTSDWDRTSAEQRYVTMRHEAVHLEQFARYTVPGMFLAYVWLPLPLGLAWCRARLEWAGYAETIRAAAEVWGPAHVRRADFRAYVIRQFTGPSYGWMWPFPATVERWYDAVVAELDSTAN